MRRSATATNGSESARRCARSCGIVMWKVPEMQGVAHAAHTRQRERARNALVSHASTLDAEEHSMLTEPGLALPTQRMRKVSRMPPSEWAPRWSADAPECSDGKAERACGSDSNPKVLEMA